MKISNKHLIKKIAVKQHILDFGEFKNDMKSNKCMMLQSLNKKFNTDKKYKFIIIDDKMIYFGLVDFCNNINLWLFGDYSIEISTIDNIIRLLKNE